MVRAVAVAALVPWVVGVAGLTGAAAAPSAPVVTTFADPAIVESSGLVARDGLLVTTNDSGDTGRVFTVDRRTGETVGVTTWSDDPVDVEALAPGGRDHPDEVWVGDLGDNDAVRDSVSVTRVPVGRGDRDVRGEVTTYRLVYPDGPADAETLLLDPASGRLVVVTKGVFGGDVLVAPERLSAQRPNRMRRVGAARAIATDGSFWPDGRHVVVRGYGSASVYSWPDLEQVARFALPEQQQGEGVAVDEDGKVLLSSEGARSEVLRLRLPAAVRRAVAPVPTATPTPAPSPGPGDDESSAPEPPTDADEERSSPGRSPWPWVAVGAVGAGGALLLLRSLRPRG